MLKKEMLEEALTAIGRIATLQEIHDYIDNFYPKTLINSKKPTKAISAQLQHYCAESAPSMYNGPPDLFRKFGPSLWGLKANLFESDLDVRSLLDRENLNETQRHALIAARLGQGKFRADVLAFWDGRCAVTGCEMGQVIRASHIKPWRDCDDRERLDPNNGIPLIANLDALFDKYLITFDELGRIICAPAITQDNKSILYGSHSSMTKPPGTKMKEYLRSHRSQYERVISRGNRMF